MRKFMEMYGSCIFSLLFFFPKNICRNPADVSFIYNRQDSHSPRALVQRSLSLQLPPQWCYPHANSLPPNLLASRCAKHCTDCPNHHRIILVLTILVLTILPTCSADIHGKQESAWEVAGTRGTSTWNLRIADG